MRCNKEEFVEGATFHIYNHSVNEIDLFNDNSDYIYFLDKFKKKYAPNDMDIYAYCLMPNHFHFCIRQMSDRPIYEMFNSFILSYSLHYNAKYKRKGALFASKLQHKRINDERYFVDICPYIHLNPKRAGLVEQIEDWEFSNYPEWIGKRNGLLFSDKLLIEIFENSEEYIKYINKFDEEKSARLELVMPCLPAGRERSGRTDL